MNQGASSKPLLEVRGLSHDFPNRSGRVQGAGRARVLDSIDMEIRVGECLALVGESGSGKTTLGRCLLRLIEPSHGRILFAGREVSAMSQRQLRSHRSEFQMVFQDPWSSLNPRMRIGEAICEPLLTLGGRNKLQSAEQVANLLDQVGLSRSLEKRFPHELSGGQRQRVAIARALATKPRLLIADEPTSALDVSVQAEILNLLSDLQKELSLALLLISHDLTLVEHMADRMAVLYFGRIVESGRREQIFETPAHPYTRALLESIPRLDRESGESDAPGSLLEGEMPSIDAPPSGCAFHSRCPIAQPVCSSESPILEPIDGEHRASCHFPLAS